MVEVCLDAVRAEKHQKAQEAHLKEPVWAPGHEPKIHRGLDLEFDGDWPCVFDLDGCE